MKSGEKAALGIKVTKSRNCMSKVSGNTKALAIDQGWSLGLPQNKTNLKNNEL